MLLQNGLQSDSEEKFKINVQKKKKKVFQQKIMQKIYGNEPAFFSR